MVKTLNEKVRDIFFTLQGKRLRHSLWLAGKVDRIYREQLRAFARGGQSAALGFAPQMAMALIQRSLREAAARSWWEGFERTVKAIPSPIGVKVIVPPQLRLEEDRSAPQDDLRSSAMEGLPVPTRSSTAWANAIYNPPTLAEIDEVISASRWAELLSGLQEPEQIVSIIRDGAAAGQSNAQIARALTPLFNGDRNRAVRIARTETHRVAQRFLERSIDESTGPLLDGYRYVATLDSRTRAHHAARDGEVYPTGSRRPVLPDGFNCRCTYVPVTKSYSDLGVPELEGLLSDSERASVNGALPAHTTYEDWFNGQSNSVKRDIVGAGRFDILSSGGGQVSWNAFIQMPASPASTPAVRTQTGRLPLRL